MKFVLKHKKSIVVSMALVSMLQMHAKEDLAAKVKALLAKKKAVAAMEALLTKKKTVTAIEHVQKKDTQKPKNEDEYKYMDAARLAAMAQMAAQNQEQPSPPKKQPVPVQAKQQDQKIIAAPAPAEPTKEEKIATVLGSLNHYIDHVFGCIKRFLNGGKAVLPVAVKGQYGNKLHKLAAFAHEIDICISEMDAQVLNPLNQLSADSVAKNLNQLAHALKHNQTQFRDTLRGGYKNSMSLGMALLSLKNQAVSQVNAVLKQVDPCLKNSFLAAQYSPLEQKVVQLTNYSVDPLKAMKILSKRI